MSGGKFEYIQYRIDRAADKVNSYIHRCESDDLNDFGYKPEYTPQTLERFRECEHTLRRAAAMLQRVDLLASGDDGEEYFHKRWAKEVPPA
jgi:hypothetical protein